MTALMDCDRARLSVLAHQRGRLDPAVTAALEAHLSGCPACAHEEAAEQLLTEQLERGLPQHAAPLALKRRLAAQWPRDPQSSLTPEVGPGQAAGRAPAALPQARPWRRFAMAAGVLLAVALAAGAGWLAGARVPTWSASGDAAQRLVTEAVNDHLRVLAKGSALEVTNSDMHQVRPWLTARLDFAPVIPFAGDADFPLRGGGVEYFLDRRAAVAVFARRLHTVTLIVTRADALPWPEAARPLVTSARGFNVRLWRRDGLGYALISDAGSAELALLAARLGG